MRREPGVQNRGSAAKATTVTPGAGRPGSSEPDTTPSTSVMREVSVTAPGGGPANSDTSTGSSSTSRPANTADFSV
jgi:hypothetical protein